MLSSGLKRLGKVILTLVLVILVDAPALRAAGPSANRPIKDKWALIVGVSKFSNSENNLRFAAKDAKDFGRFLVREANFAPDHVKVLTDDRATRLNILEELGDRWLPRVVEPDDLVVLYISSHGSPADADVVGVNYIIAHDTQSDALYATGIPTQDLIKMIRSRIKSDRIVLVLDACFSGAAAAPDPTGAFKQRSLDADEFAYGTNQLVICSSKPNETSAESPQLNNGVFTHYLIEGLRLHGSSTKLADAFNYCRDKVLEYTTRSGHTQTPVLASKWKEGTGLLLSALPGAPHSSIAEETPPEIASALPPTTAPFVAPSSPQASASTQATIVTPHAAETPEPANTPPSNVVWGRNVTAGLKAEKAGDLQEAEQYFRSAVKEGEKFGPRDIRLASSLNNLALLLNQTLRSKEAEELARRALEIYREALGPEHRYVASVLANLGQIKETEGDFKSVEELYTQALSIMQEKLGPEDPHLANTLGHLGELSMKEGKYEEAERRMRRALQIQEKSYGHESKPVAVQLNSLGLLSESRHRYDEAATLFQQSLQIMEKVLPGNSTDAAVTMNNLGRVYAAQGKYDKAEPLIARAVEIHREKKTTHYPVALYQLADVYTALGQYYQAERMYREALRVTEETYGSEHPVAAVILHGLGIVYYKEKRYSESEDCFERALALKQKLYSSQHQEIAATCVELANSYRDDKKYDKADPLYQRALAIYTKVLGAKSWDVYYTSKKYWRLLEACHRSAEAEKIKAIWTALEPQFAK